MLCIRAHCYVGNFDLQDREVFVTSSSPFCILHLHANRLFLEEVTSESFVFFPAHFDSYK